jgi:surface carbohydrate biosynthesis protein (TIGR04326 family)
MPEGGSRQHTENPDTLLVWDAEDPPPATSSILVLWRSFVSAALPEAVSIPELVERDAVLLRRQYLSWIFELGQTSIQGRSLAEHLQLREGFDYWWMTLLAEKCNYGKSPQIEDAIRLMAFEGWATSHSFSYLELATSNSALARCMRLWCEMRGLSFVWRILASQTPRLTWLRRVNQSLPNPVRALAWLILYAIRRWPLRGAGLSEWKAGEGRICFVSYLFNLIPEAEGEGRFESRYWGSLPDILMREQIPSNWLHLYVPDEVLPNPACAAETVRRFNGVAAGIQTHVTLDTFLGPAVLINTLRDWLHLVRIGLRLRRGVFKTQGKALDLGPLFDEEWQRSLFGQPALNNILFYNLLEAALKTLPRQNVGIYLQENQGWEFGFIQVWKAAGHGRMIGSPHSTVRFWDLRYFFDPRSYRDSGRSKLPLPNHVALNGPAALEAYAMAGYSENDLVEVEALRYLYLGADSARPKPTSRSAIQPLRVLVLGDYLSRNTQRMLRLLEKSADSLPTDIAIVVKSHPACPVDPDEYPGLKMRLADKPLAKLLGDCDVAYTSSSTSAAVDAYCAGVPVVSLADPCSLNLSPLRGRRDVVFINTPDQLTTALGSVFVGSCQEHVADEFFALDPELPRWRSLLLNTAGADCAPFQHGFGVHCPMTFGAFTQ